MFPCKRNYLQISVRKFNLDEIKNQTISLVMNIIKLFSSLNSLLIKEIVDSCQAVDIEKNTEVMREGQYVKMIPLVTKGLVKVFMRYHDKELLLYYIQPGETCIMSFDACLQNKPSRIYAVTEEDSTVLLLPAENVFRWMKKYPDMNSMFFSQYNSRYNELIHMISDILFENMDSRLQKYLKTKTEVLKKNPLKISHKQIANDLGTAREVISRVVKKLENEGKLRQLTNGIEVF